MYNILDPNSVPTDGEFLGAVAELNELARSQPPAPQGAAFVRWFLHHDERTTRCEAMVEAWLAAHVPAALLRLALERLAECAGYDPDGGER